MRTYHRSRPRLPGAEARQPRHHRPRTATDNYSPRHRSSSSITLDNSPPAPPARCVELRFFGGLTIEETAEVLNSEGFEASTRTVERDWNFAKAWLNKYIESL